jgi:hypothetical protein
MCGELDKFGYEVVEEIDALNSDVELGGTILCNLFESVEYGLISDSEQKLNGQCRSPRRHSCPGIPFQ